MDIYCIGSCCDFFIIVASCILCTQGVDHALGNSGKDQRGGNIDPRFFYYSDSNSHLERLVWKEGYFTEREEIKFGFPSQKPQVYQGRHGKSLVVLNISMIRFKIFLKHFFAIVFGILLALMIIEIVLRVWHPFAYTVRGDKIILPANIQVRMKNLWIRKLDDTIYYSRNAIGLRGEPWPANPENLITIITVGGSTTECKFLSDNKTWPELLKRDLKPDHPNIWLNNAGLDGHSTFGHLVLLKDYLIKLHPDYILFLTGVNDVELDQPADLDYQDIRGIHGHSIKYFLKSVINYTETGTLLLSLYRNYLAYRKGLIHKELDPTQLETGVTDSLTRKNKIALQRKYLNQYAGRLKELASESVDHGIKPVFITQPALFGNVLDSATGIYMGNRILDGYDCTTDWEVLQLYNEEVRNLRRDGIIVVDLAAAMPKNSKYFYDFMHYTNAGAEKLAAILADSLRPIIK